MKPSLGRERLLFALAAAAAAVLLVRGVLLEQQQETLFNATLV